VLYWLDTFPKGSIFLVDLVDSVGGNLSAAYFQTSKQYEHLQRWGQPSHMGCLAWAFFRVIANMIGDTVWSEIGNSPTQEG